MKLTRGWLITDEMQCNGLNYNGVTITRSVWVREVIHGIERVKDCIMSCVKDIVYGNINNTFGSYFEIKLPICVDKN